MELISGVFAAFVLVALLVYYPLPRRLQNLWLLLASFVFYLTWAWQLALALTVLTAINYGLGILLRPGGARRPLLWIGVAANVSMLVAFKYAGFFIDALMHLLGMAGDPGALQVLVPVGLSYLVLGMISYLVDSYRGQIAEPPSVIDFALYAAYFPKLIAGPIERAQTFLPQLAKDRVVDNEALARSITLIVVGLARKLVIAGFLGPQAVSLFERPGRTGPTGLIAALVFYAFYLYNDFAGYTGIVRGVSGLFGIELGPNFMAPFFARNFTEFWNRWHISLSQWLRDYIYFPITRSLLRRNPDPRWLPNVIIAPVVTMLISGLWHGAALNLLFWGLLHGVYQAVERLGAVWARPTPPDKWPLWRQIGGGLMVFGLATAAWLPFRDANFFSGRFMRAFESDGRIGVDGTLMTCAALMAVSLLMDMAQLHTQDEAGFRRWPRIAQSAALAVAVLTIFLSALQPVPTFVYQGF